jgi:transposase
MTFYCGIDLHSRKSHVCIIDKHGKKVKKENLNNDLSLILEFLEPFGKDVHIAVESTINWYWIVDGLMEAGYDVRLAHTLGLYMITGAKVKTDRRGVPPAIQA